MSTFINVTVDGGGLSERAKAQTNANRQAKLEGDNRQKVEAKGREQRDANRAEQGIGPDGQPLSGTPPRNTLRSDEPAAQRLTSSGIPYYFFSFTGSNGYAVASGNAEQQAGGTFSIGSNFTTWARETVPYPITNLLPSDHTFASSTLVTTLDGDSYYKYISVKEVSTTYEPLDTPFYGIYNYTQTRVLERAILYWFPESGAIESIGVRMPLGKGQAVDFRQRRGYMRASAAMTLQQSTEHRYVQIVNNYIIDYGYFIYDRLDSFAKVLDQQYFDFAKDSFCFRVGEKTATSITPPSELLSAIDDLLPKQEAYQYSVLAEAYGFVDSLYWAGGEPNYIGYGSSVTITGFQTNVTDPNYPTICDYYSGGYAFATPPGGYTSYASTPLTWFILDSDTTRNQLFGDQTIDPAAHAEMLQVALSGSSTTISAALRGKYLGFDQPTAFGPYATTPGSYLYGWGSPSQVPTYNNSDPSYGYPLYTQTIEEGNLWKPRRARISKGCATYGPGDSVNSQTWQKVFIYDWTNPVFCGQQAARYGL